MDHGQPSTGTTTAVAVSVQGHANTVEIERRGGR